MPPPTITCPICQGVVSKRQSLVVEPYGRICRLHPEVEQHKAKIAELAKQAADDREQAAKWKQATDGLNKMMFVEQLRVMAAMKNVSLELVIMTFKHQIPQSIREDVIKEVREKGPMSEKEMDDAISMAAYMITKGLIPKG